MSIEVILHCDANLTPECYCLSADMVVAKTIREVQAEARSDGWRVRGRKAICPDCSDRGATLKNPRPGKA